MIEKNRRRARSIWRTVLALGVGLGLGHAIAAEPLYVFPLDGTGEALVRPGAQPEKGIVYGRETWTKGVSGQGLDVRRHAYDQATCFVADALKGFNPQAGTVAFWFKPHWVENEPGGHTIVSGWEKDWKPFRFYMTKNQWGMTDLSVVAPKQVQILKKDIFKKDVWTHIAFTWDAKNDEVVLYVDGKPFAQRKVPGAFSCTSADAVKFALGDGSSDRFKAKTGDGVYDDVRIYDTALPATEIFRLVMDGNAQALEPAAKFPGLDFAFACATNRLSGAAPLVALAPGEGKKTPRLTLSAMGASGRLGLVLETAAGTETLESADTFNLRVPVPTAFTVEDGTLVWTLAGAEQGRIPFAGAAGDFAQALVAPGVRFVPKSKLAKSSFFERRDRIVCAPGEAALWDLSDAQRRTDGVRRGVTLNGYWRVQPVDDFTLAPPTGDWRYVRVPGSFRSPLWRLNELKDGKIAPPADVDNYKGKDRTHYRAAWYQRTFATPENAAGDHIWLNFENLNADTGRVYLNGKQICAFRQDGRKYFTTIPNARRLDVTSLLTADGTPNVLTVYVDRHYTALWKGQLSIGDHNEIALGDVWLETAPGGMFLSTAVALSSYRQKTVTLRARIANPARIRGAARVRFAFARDGQVAYSAERNVVLDGSPEQKVVWTEEWKKPVLWNVETPEVYEMRVTLLDRDRAIDSFPARPFGFREAWVENGEILLNGVPTRLRMWTSPGLTRLRYYYGTPETIGQYVAHIKEINYNAVRFDPLAKFSQVSWPEYLAACDTMGLYNLFPMPPYEDEPLAPYTEDVARFLDVYGGHPSIIMWYTDFNTCSYSWNQDPAKLNDTDYVPAWHKNERARVRQAEKTMRALDPTREIFQHAGGSSGPIFTSMNYQSYGTPLQEQEDWPAQWAARHSRPLMVVETAFPYPAQFMHFDNPKLGSLIPEHAARYFGDAVYGRETDPVPYYSEWTQPVARPMNPNQRALVAAHHLRVVKAWRGYGLNALGDFPGARDLTLTARTFDGQNVVWNRSGAVKTAGLKPDNPEGPSETQRHLLTDYSLPDYLYDTIREVYSPLLVFLAGDPKDFTNKDHAYFAGEKIVKSVVAVNDHVTPRKLTCRWKLRCGNDVLAQDDFTFKVAAGGLERKAIVCTAPETATRRTGRLEIEVLSDGRCVKTDAMDLQFWPAARAPEWSDVACALYDPAGRTAPVLKAAGFPFRPVEGLGDLGEARLLIVGSLALDGTNAFLQAVEASGAIDRGLKVLVFEQKAGALPGFEMVAPSARDAFVRLPGSPYVKGLSDADLHDWRGASDVMPAFVLSDERTPHYPRSKWKCGNGGMVSGYAIKKPSRGNFRTIVDCGFNLAYASLLEYRRNHGLVVFCQLDVTARYGKDPAATHLVHNLLRNMGNRFVPVGPQRAGYVGDDKGAALLDRLGVSCRRLQPWDLYGNAGVQVLIVGAGPVAKDKEDALRQVVSRVETALFLPGAPLDLLPEKVQATPRRVYRASAPENEPAFAGIAAADLYFRTARTLPVYTGAPDWFAAAKPALMGRLGNCILMPPAPESVDGLWNGEKLSRVWSTILNELNVGLAEDSRLFTPGKVAPYAVKPDPYDGDAFHNW